MLLHKVLLLKIQRKSMVTILYIPAKSWHKDLLYSVLTLGYQKTYYDELYDLPK
jgi:hypothetical protein